MTRTHYYVFNASTYSRPMVKHESHESALEEAKRLAAKQPGDVFEVLECIAEIKTKYPLVVNDRRTGLTETI